MNLIIRYIEKYIPTIIGVIITLLVSLGNTKIQVLKLKEETKLEIKKAREQFAHEMNIKDKDHKNEIEMLKAHSDTEIRKIQEEKGMEYLSNVTNKLLENKDIMSSIVERERQNNKINTHNYLNKSRKGKKR